MGSQLSVSGDVKPEVACKNFSKLPVAHVHRKARCVKEDFPTLSAHDTRALPNIVLT